MKHQHIDATGNTGGTYRVIAGGAPVTVLPYHGVVTIEQGPNRYSASVEEWAALAEMAMVDQARRTEHAAGIEEMLADGPGVITAPAGGSAGATGPDLSTVALRRELVELLMVHASEWQVTGLVVNAAMLERYILDGEVPAGE